MALRELYHLPTVPHLWFSLHVALSGAYPLQAAAAFLTLSSVQCQSFYNSSLGVTQLHWVQPCIGGQ